MEVTYDEFCTIAGGSIFRSGGWRQKLKDFVVWSGSKSNYLSKKLLDFPLSATSYTSPTTTYIALWTSTLDDTSTGSTTGEAAYTSYARVALTNNTTNWPASTGTTTASKSNGVAITFPASTGSTSTVTYLAICDASTAGNMLYWCTVSSTTVNSGDTPQVASSGLTITED